MKFPCTQHQGQYLYVFVQLAHRAACLSLEWEPAERWSSSGESSAAPDTAEKLQKEILPLGYWNFIIPDQTDDLKDLVRINYISGEKKKKGSELAPGDGKTMQKELENLIWPQLSHQLSLLSHVKSPWNWVSRAGFSEELRPELRLERQEGASVEWSEERAVRKRKELQRSWDRLKLWVSREQ